MNDQPSLSPFWREDLAHKLLLIPTLLFWSSILYHVVRSHATPPFALPIYQAGWLTVALLSALVWLHKPWSCKIICTLFFCVVFYSLYPSLLEKDVNHTALQVLLITSLVLLSLNILDTAWKCYFSMVEERGKLRPHSFWLWVGGFLLPLLPLCLYDLLIGGATSLTLTVVIQALQTFFDSRFPVVTGVGGRILFTHGSAQRYFDKLRPPKDPGINFSGLRIPTNSAVQNFLLVGAIGGGKTNELRLLLQSILPQIHDSGE